MLLSNVDSVPSLTDKVVTGGRLNACKTVTITSGGNDTTGPRLLTATADASDVSPVSSVRVLFDEEIDPATFTPDDVTNFVGPDGVVLTVKSVKPVADSDNRQFDVMFATQSVPGNYRMEIGPDIRDLAGNAMDLDRDSMQGEPRDDVANATFTIVEGTKVSGTPRAGIPDRGRLKVSRRVRSDLVIDHLYVTFTIKHTFDADLSIHLLGPDGTDVLLVNRRGGDGDNFLETKLEDAAETSIGNARAPFSGSFRPESPLGVFAGQNARGTWKLIVNDQAKSDVGKLISWSVVIVGDFIEPAATTATDTSTTTSASPSCATTASIALTSSAAREGSPSQTLLLSSLFPAQVWTHAQWSDLRLSLSGKMIQQTQPVRHHQEPSLDSLMAFFQCILEGND